MRRKSHDPRVFKGTSDLALWVGFYTSHVSFPVTKTSRALQVSQRGDCRGKSRRGGQLRSSGYFHCFLKWPQETSLPVLNVDRKGIQRRNDKIKVADETSL